MYYSNYYSLKRFSDFDFSKSSGNHFFKIKNKKILGPVRTGPDWSGPLRNGQDRISLRPVMTGTDRSRTDQKMSLFSNSKN